MRIVEKVLLQDYSVEAIYLSPDLFGVRGLCTGLRPGAICDMKVAIRWGPHG